MCAQIVAPYAPAGRIAVASQSGNFVSSFLNLAHHTGVGRQPGRGGRQRRRARDRRLPRVVRRRSGDHACASSTWSRSTTAARCSSGCGGWPERKPIVVVKGGASAPGARAAASHTGALATDDADLRRHVSPGRPDPCPRRRGGLRGGRHARHATHAHGRPGGRRHHRRRLGCRRGRCDGRDPTRAPSRCPTTCAPRSTRSSRRAGARTTRSTWPAERPATPCPRSSSWSPSHPDVDAVALPRYSASSRTPRR